MENYDNLVVVGNPGSGKSTLLNTLLGSAVFPAGVSDDGRGLTKDHSSIKWDENELILTDTPGVAEASTVEHNLAEIRRGLVRLPSLKLLCIVTMHNEVPHDIDVVALTTVLQPFVAAGVDMTDRYGIVVNRLSRRLQSKETRMKIKETFFDKFMVAPETPGHVRRRRSIKGSGGGGADDGCEGDDEGDGGMADNGRKEGAFPMDKKFIPKTKHFHFISKEKVCASQKNAILSEAAGDALWEFAIEQFEGFILSDAVRRDLRMTTDFFYSEVARLGGGGGGGTDAAAVMADSAAVGSGGASAATSAGHGNRRRRDRRRSRSRPANDNLNDNNNENNDNSISNHNYGGSGGGQRGVERIHYREHDQSPRQDERMPGSDGPRPVSMDTHHYSPTRWPSVGRNTRNNRNNNNNNTRNNRNNQSGGREGRNRSRSRSRSVERKRRFSTPGRTRHDNNGQSRANRDDRVGDERRHKGWGIRFPRLRVPWFGSRRRRSDEYYPGERNGLPPV